MKVTHVAAIAVAGIVLVVAGKHLLDPPKPPAKTLVLESVGGTTAPVTLQPTAIATDADKARLADLQRRERRWEDAVKLASVTSRIQLAPVVQDLQAQAREYEALELPGCLSAAKPYLVESKTATVKGMVEFMEDATFGKYAYANAAETAERADRNVRMVVEGCKN